MSEYGAKAYTNLAVDSSVKTADPHAMVLMLFDGAIEAARQAFAHLRAGRVPEKCAAIGKAIRIVDEGLKTSLDQAAGGAMAQQLAALYDYCVLRLLQANLRNDEKALIEVAKLLTELREAWAGIGNAGKTAAAGAAPRSASAAAPAATATTATTATTAAAAGAPAMPADPGTDHAYAARAPAPRFIDGPASGPVRRFVVSA